MKPILFALMILVFVSCKKPESVLEDYQFEGKGKIIELEASYWQYGTHTISIDNKFYALKSDKIDLYKYNSNNVTIWADKIIGYPIGDGPEFLLVKRISKNKVFW